MGHQKEEKKMSKIKRREFWKEWLSRLRSIPFSWKIVLFVVGVAFIIIGIMPGPKSISIPILLTGIALLLEAPIIFFVELKREYAKKKTK